MTFAADRWSQLQQSPLARPARRRGGVGVVWRIELVKFTRLLRVRVVAGACLGVPFLVAAAVKVQSAVPADTLFGQWLHESGFALPMVVLSFAGQWVLPLLTALVAGDVFSSEDHLGTWKTVLTRSRTRGELFAGKALAALTYTMAMVVLLALSSLAAGTLLGTQPIVGLSGQLVSSGHAAGLVVASWAVALPPELAFCALAIALSIASRNSVVGIGAPVVLGLIMQLSAFVELPSGLRYALLSTPFTAWRGFWVESAFYGPLWRGLIASVVWFFVCAAAAWLIFRDRSVRVS